MSTTTRNEAAERLREWIDDIPTSDLDGKSERQILDVALADERRATVERIQERFALFGDGDGAKAFEQATTISLRDVRAILAEEAQR